MKFLILEDSPSMNSSFFGTRVVHQFEAPTQEQAKDIGKKWIKGNVSGGSSYVLLPNEPITEWSAQDLSIFTAAAKTA